MSKKNSKAPKGPAHTTEGTLPPTMLKAHKLTDGPVPEHTMEAKEIASGAHRKQMKKLVQLAKTYRLLAHGVVREHLASPLVLGLRYFCDMQKAPSRNQDRNATSEDTDDSVKSVFAKPLVVR